MTPIRESVPTLRAFAAALLLTLPSVGFAQVDVTPVDLSIGRSLPVTEAVPITKVSIANPEIADIVVIGPREIVINAKTAGETDAILWLANGTRRHFRVSVRSAPDRNA